jgi:hypothetical protein
MKKLVNLKGITTLSEVEQKNVLGGYMSPGCLSANMVCHTAATNSNNKCCNECGNVNMQGYGVCT